MVHGEKIHGEMFGLIALFHFIMASPLRMNVACTYEKRNTRHVDKAFCTEHLPTKPEAAWLKTLACCGL